MGIGTQTVIAVVVDRKATSTDADAPLTTVLKRDLHSTTGQEEEVGRRAMATDDDVLMGTTIVDSQNEGGIHRMTLTLLEYL